MALKRLIGTSTQFYYAKINQLIYVKPNLTQDQNYHQFSIELEIRDSADPAYLQVENRFDYRPPVQMKPDANAPTLYQVVSDPFDLTVLNTNLVAQAYVWLKGNIALFADFVNA